MRLVSTIRPNAGTASPVMMMTIAMTTASSINEKPDRLLIAPLSWLPHGSGNLLLPRDAVARECGLVGTILCIHRPRGPGRIVLRSTDDIVILCERCVIVRGTRVQGNRSDTIQLTEKGRVIRELQQDVGRLC